MAREFSLQWGMMWTFYPLLYFSLLYCRLKLISVQQCVLSPSNIHHFTVSSLIKRWALCCLPQSQLCINILMLICITTSNSEYWFSIIGCYSCELLRYFINRCQFSEVDFVFVYLSLFCVILDTVSGCQHWLPERFVFETSCCISTQCTMVRVIRPLWQCIWW